jgi:hypothetical protein
VAPRFQPVGPATRYDDEKGYGWLTDGQRDATAIPLTPYLEVRGVAKDPKNLPRDVLFRDFIHGTGTQKFGVKAEPGEYRVALLHPDRTTSELKLTASNGRLEVPFPSGEWSVSGVIVRAAVSENPSPLPAESKRLPRPGFRHEPPDSAQAGQPLTLRLTISNAAHVSRVRLHYRPVNQLAHFRTIEKAPGETFVIPEGDVSSDYDLMYYFEVLNDANGGWFQPDPLTQTPYYVVKTRP